MSASDVAGVRQPAAPGRSVSLVLVAAVAENGVIGQGGALPWRLKSDMKLFRAATMGKPVVMGRRTYLSIARLLVGRTNIVVSRDPAFEAPGVVAAPSVEAALTVARGDALRRGVGEIAIIGGADIYAQTIDRADRLVITRVHLRPSGDTTFPAIDPAIWRERERTSHDAGPDDDAGFALVVYERRAAGGGTEGTRQPEIKGHALRRRTRASRVVTE